MEVLSGKSMSVASGALRTGAPPRQLGGVSDFPPRRSRREFSSAVGQKRQRPLVVSRVAASASVPAEEVDPNEYEWTEGDSESAPPSEDTLQFAKFLANMADQTKCEDVKLYYVGKLIYWTDYFLVASVFSKPQMNAVLGKMEKAAEEEWNRCPGEANPGRSEWEILDFSDLVIHVMSPETRDFYGLEELYEKAEEIPLEFGPGATAPEWSASMKD
ncbi:hypothetical protein BSKO_07777 [Bryopsis sp. KO-2023]|nr:hypothetical protein BSKO_07777 [Bryopsis sp. KO-2023]